VTRTSRSRLALFAVSLLLSVTLVSAHASAALDMVVGTHLTVPGKTIADCGTRAQAALSTVLQSAIKAGDDGTNWLGYGRTSSTADPSATIIIHCIPTDAAGGYIASFTCSAEVPPNPSTAVDLCNKITNAFGVTP